MHLISQHLLAEGEIPIKLIVGAIVFVIWVISQVVTAVTKPKDTHLPAGKPMQSPGMPPPKPVVPPMPKRKVVVTNPVVSSQKRKVPPYIPPQQQRAARKGPPPLKQRSKPAEALVTLSDVVPAVVAKKTAVVSPAKPVKKVAEGPNPNERLRAILRPANLRKDYILTELLRPPLSMRNPD